MLSPIERKRVTEIVLNQLLRLHEHRLSIQEAAGHSPFYPQHEHHIRESAGGL